MDRYVNVISGLPSTGKSYLIRQEGMQGAVVSMDQIGQRLWGERQALKAGSSLTELTPHEKIWRNKYTRLEIEKMLVVDNAEVVLAEMPLLTSEYHQRPLVQMIQDAQWFIRQIERDKGCPQSSSVHLNVVLLYASLEIVRERTKRKLKEHTNSDAKHIHVYLDAALRFDFPECYTPLLVDTTDESPESNKKRLEDIISFFRGGILQADLHSINQERLTMAKRYLNQARQEAIRSGIRI